MLVDVEPELRSQSESVPLNWVGLQAHMAAVGMRFEAHPVPRQFAGGLANLNYLVVIDGHEAVLRRPPLGTLPPGAYDMGREFRILQALSKAFPLAPKAIHLCTDADVIGAPFQIIEYRRGFAVRGARLPAALANAPDIGHRLSRTVIESLVALHRLDADKVGLGALGNPNGFLARARDGWIKRALLAVEAPATAVSSLIDWLRAQAIPVSETTLLHNDFKLDNLLLDGATLMPVAVLDWDQGTRGDPLFDLATTLSYWVEPTDPVSMQALQQMPTAQPGFMSRREAAAFYAEQTGRDLSDFRFYRVLALFKLAVIFYQLHMRYREGVSTDPRYAGLDKIADGVMEFADLVAHGELF